MNVTDKVQQVGGAFPTTPQSLIDTIAFLAKLEIDRRTVHQIMHREFHISESMITLTDQRWSKIRSEPDH